MGVPARIGTSSATGMVEPKVGDPNDLLLQYLPANSPPRRANRWSPRAPSRRPTTRSTRRDRDRPGHLGQRRKRLQVGQRRPAANLHNLDIVAGADLRRRAGGAANLSRWQRTSRAGQRHRRRRQIDSAASTGYRRMSGPSLSLLGARGGASVIIVFFQIGVVSEVPVFGVSVDLTPLLVVFVGLLCGSVLGAAAGFAVGLLVDLALLQTLGLTSLIFTLIGYWCGRLRELRDPQAALTPLLVGAAWVGRLADRLLADGVHARRRRPGQLRAAAPDRARDRRQHDRRAADVAARAARSERRRCPRIRAGAAQAGLHDRRAEPLSGA